MVLTLTLSQHIKMWIRGVNVVNIQQCYFGFNEHHALGVPLGRIYQYLERKNRFFKNSASGFPLSLNLVQFQPDRIDR